MVIDPYKDPAVMKRMSELQQRRYRQGHRNATDVRGNPAYILTEDEKISCLDHAMQRIVLSEKAKIQKLQDYAQPFHLSIGIGESPPSYVVSVTHPSYGHARRSGPTNMIDSMKVPDSWFRQQIDSMKAEVGYAISPLQGPIDDKLQQKKERGFSVTDKRAKTPAAPLHCPDHGNELVRGSDPDTLICTVVGCKKLARKKNRAKSFVKDPVVEELTKQEIAEKEAETVTEREELVKDLKNIQKNFGNAVEGYTHSATATAAASIQKILESANLLGPVGYGGVAPAPQREANFNDPELVAGNGRYYLVQRALGGESYVDITSVLEAQMQVGSIMELKLKLRV